jgi:hypothetical protein
MVVDGGPNGIYENALRPALMALPRPHGNAPSVDVLVLSHVDDDHAVGVMRLLRELVQTRRAQLPLPIEIRRAWFNSVDDLIEKVQPGLPASVRALVEEAPYAAVPVSYSQGRDVRNSLAYLGLDSNRPFGGSLTVGMATWLDNLEVTVVGPRVEALAKLADQWRASVQAKDRRAIAAAYRDNKIQNLSRSYLKIV